MEEVVSREKEQFPSLSCPNNEGGMNADAPNKAVFFKKSLKVNVPVEFHMYPAGGHGLSTCTEQSMNVDGYGVQEQCQSWLPLVRTWLAEKVRCKTDTNVLG